MGRLPFGEEYFDVILADHVGESVGTDEQPVAREQAAPIVLDHGFRTDAAADAAVDGFPLGEGYHVPFVYGLVDREPAQHSAAKPVAAAVADVHEQNLSSREHESGQSAAHRLVELHSGRLEIEFGAYPQDFLGENLFRIVPVAAAVEDQGPQLLESVATGHFAVLVAAHAVGDQQEVVFPVAESVHEAGLTVAYQVQAGSGHVLVAAAHAALVGKAEDVEFHGCIILR